ncbi:MAG: 3-oxoacid CoA-transferase subunit A [Pseudomonadota bacterium]|nr:3-oxoacid CoA-transferase subunit A [Pseudomonadota bacterium]MBV1714345.1 3-oxoacid CoA-transferase subunit A [Desulfarculus sp.]MBU4575667.1 3-oxoacid CoA-transferase subunit A [Pseudomonadota bacterium]MBU4597164.1 3-oxoacid CoA-transferase subunit A [Pseudomonadota bacterium]MBV1738201.1 3-oxoacid CoA-transferase subunit A [Desulfarculus sp.]
MNKVCSLEEALSRVNPGDTVMVGGFGVPGTPFTLLDGLLKGGVNELTVVKNEANEDHMGISKLVEAGLVRKMITTHLGLNKTVIGMMNRGEVEVEFYPQGILAEKIRAGGAGLFGLLTDIGMDTELLSSTKQTMWFEGRELIVESALKGDVALLHAAKADRFGNLVYAKSAMNFNPVMATAATTVIAEVEEVVEIGDLDPEHVHTPGAFVDHVVLLEELSEEYGILEHHII